MINKISVRITGEAGQDYICRIRGGNSVLGVVREACAAVKDTGFIHYPQIWPFPALADFR